MKKLICTVLCMALLCCAALPAAVLAATPGDVNGDGKISAQDALLILRHAVGKEELSGDALWAADVTGKRDPNAADALCVLQKAVGKRPYFAVERIDPSGEEITLHCSVSEDDDFVPGEILVAIKAAYSAINKVWKPSDFPGLSGITEIEDMTYADTQDAIDVYEAVENFHQLLVIHIADTSKAAVISGIRVLETNDVILCAQPNRIYHLDDSWRSGT